VLGNGEMNIQKPVKRATEVTEPGAVASGTKAQPDQSVIDFQNDAIVEPLFRSLPLPVL